MGDEPRMKIADLDDKSLGKVQALEQELGACVVALEREVELLNLAEEDLDKLQAAEQELGVVLMAYRCK